MRTKEHNSATCRKGNCIQCLRENREPAVEACLKVQLSTKTGSKGEYKTEIIDKQCSRLDGEVCGACFSPNAKWRHGKCNLATHLYHEVKKGQPHAFITPTTMTVEAYQEQQQKLNPIKASKRRSR